jgi:integrase
LEVAIALQLDPEHAQLDDRRSGPANGVRRKRQPERHSVRLPKWLAVAEDAIVAWRRLGTTAGGAPAVCSHEIERLRKHLGATWGPLAVFAAETGLRTHEWAALERRDVDRAGAAVAVERKCVDGVLTPYPKTNRSRRRVPLTHRALEALESLPVRLKTRLLFPAARGGYIGLDTWRNREWYPALEAAGIDQRGPYHLRHPFATEALAAGISIFELARVMGTSVKKIDDTYGHARDSEDAIRARLNARAGRLGVDWASEPESD